MLFCKYLIVKRRIISHNFHCKIVINYPACSRFFGLYVPVFLTFNNKYCCITETAKPNNYICSLKAYPGKSIFDILATPSSEQRSIDLIHYTLISLSDLPLSLETHFFLLWLPHNFFALYFYRCLLAINTNEISLLNSILLVHLQLWPNFPTRETDWTFQYLMDGSKHSTELDWQFP